jgi:hypothetical protein
VQRFRELLLEWKRAGNVACSLESIFIDQGLTWRKKRCGPVAGTITRCSHWTGCLPDAVLGMFVRRLQVQ